MRTTGYYTAFNQKCQNLLHLLFALSLGNKFGTLGAVALINPISCLERGT